MKMKMKMHHNKIEVNGVKYRGYSVSINNGKVVIDGVTQDQTLIGEVNVTVHGDIAKLENESGNVYANDVGTIQTVSGDVTCGDVDGNVQTMSGDVKCKNVNGDITSMSGDINNE